MLDSGIYETREEVPPNDPIAAPVVRVSKKQTLQAFIDLYAGPEYILYSQYSSMLVMVFVSFMYGLIMPILFPICVIGLANITIVDQLALTYYYRAPPRYDGKLNKLALDLLTFAPIMMCVIGYWALSNA